MADRGFAYFSKIMRYLADTAGYSQKMIDLKRDVEFYICAESNQWDIYSGAKSLQPIYTTLRTDDRKFTRTEIVYQLGEFGYVSEIDINKDLTKSLVFIKYVSEILS